jgi:hypothetical protein
MKNLTLVIFVSLLFISCGKKEIKKVKIDPAFNSHIEEFKQNSQLAGNSVKIDNLVMEFVSSLDQYNNAGNTLGVCYQSYREEKDWLGNKKVYATPVIHIDRVDWDRLSLAGRKQLSFHELGHCVLDRPHSESTNSIMYPYHNVVQNSFITRYNSMVYELFNPNKTVAAVGFQAINIASTLDDPNIESDIVLENESLDEFANTNMKEEETGHIVHDEDCHKIIKIESKEDF